jgi:hypothetical protein
MISPRACSDIDVLEPFFPFFGFTMGDWRIPRAFRGFCNDFLLAFLGRILEFAGAECESKFMSIGEFVAPECR